MKCKYCENTASKKLCWLKDKQGRSATVRVPWCGCDLMTALKQFYPNPYPVQEGVDYRVEPLMTNPLYKIDEKTGESERIPIAVSRFNGEPNFDKACEQAYQMALTNFGCDDCGHLNNVEGSERSRDSVVVEFKNYRHYGGMGGQNCEYLFEAWVERHEDDEDEEVNK